MSWQPNFHPAHDDQLRQKLWEYVYELLPANQMEEWTRRVTSDPHIARLYAEVKLQAGRIAEALVHAGPTVPLRVPELASAPPSATTDGVPAVVPGISRSGKVRRRLPRIVCNLVAVAATLLIAAGWWVVQFGNLGTTGRTADSPLPPIPLTRLLLPSSTAGKLPVSVMIETRDAVYNQPLPTEVTVTVGDGQSRWTETHRTDTRGLAKVLVPSEYAQAREILTVTPAGNKALAVRAPLPPPRDSYIAHLFTDRLVYYPGETVRFRAVILDAVSLSPVHPIKVSCRIVNDRTHIAYPNSVIETETSNGVAVGAFRLPEEQVDKNNPTILFGSHSLVLESTAGEFPSVKRRFFVLPTEPAAWGIDLELGRDSYRAGETVQLDVAVAGTLPVAEPIVVTVRFGTGSTSFEEKRLIVGAGQAGVVQWQAPAEWPNEPVFVEAMATVIGERAYRVLHVPRADAPPVVRFFPEGGELVPGLPSRVYFEVQDELGLPMAFRGELVDDQGHKVLDLATHPAVPGRGVWTWTPVAGKRYHVKDVSSSKCWPIAVPGDDTDDAAVLRIEPGAVQAREPVRVKVYAKKPRKPMLLVVSRMNVPVAQASLLTNDTSPAEPVEVKLDIPPQVSGVLRITLFDVSREAARAVAERLVFRSPASTTHIQPQNVHDLVAGRLWHADFSVVNQLSQPIEGVAGVAIEPQDAPFASTASLSAEALLAADCPLLFEDEPVEVYFDNRFQSLESIDLLLGTRGWRRIEQLSDASVAVRIPAGGLMATEGPWGDSNAPAIAGSVDRATGPLRSLPARGHDSQSESADEVHDFFSMFATTAVEPPIQRSNSAAVSQWTRLSEATAAVPEGAPAAVEPFVLLVASLVVLLLLIIAGWLRYVSSTVWIPSLAIAGLVLMATAANVATPGKTLPWRRPAGRTELAMAPESAQPLQADAAAERTAGGLEATAPASPQLGIQEHDTLAQSRSLQLEQSLSQPQQTHAPPSEAVVSRPPPPPPQMRQNGLMKNEPSPLPAGAGGRATTAGQPAAPADSQSRTVELSAGAARRGAPPGIGGGGAGVGETAPESQSAVPGTPMQPEKATTADSRTGRSLVPEDAARDKSPERERKPSVQAMGRLPTPEDTNRSGHPTADQGPPTFQYLAMRQQVFRNLSRQVGQDSRMGEVAPPSLSLLSSSAEAVKGFGRFPHSGVDGAKRVRVAQADPQNSPAVADTAKSGTLAGAARKAPSDGGLWEPLLSVDNGRLLFAWHAPQGNTPHIAKIMVHGEGIVGELHWPVRPAPPVNLQIEPSPNKPIIFCETDQWQWPIHVTNRSGHSLRLTSLTMTGGGEVEISPSFVEVADGDTSAVRVSASIAPANAPAPLRIVGQDSVYRAEPDAGQGVWPAELRWKFEPNHYLIRNEIGVTPRGYPHWVRRFDTSGTHRVLELGRTPHGSTWRVASVRMYPSWAAEVIDTVRWLARQSPDPPLRRWVAVRTLAWLERENVAAPFEKRLLKRWLQATWPEELAGYSAHERAWLTLERMALQPNDASGNHPVPGVTDASDTPLPLVLAARIAVLRSDGNATELLQQLVEQQWPSGAIAAAAWPENLTAPRNADRQASVEATAVAVLAWSDGPGQEQFAAARDRALDWLRTQRQADGGFGPTYASCLALLALLSRPNGTPQDVHMHSASCKLDGKEVEALKFYRGSFEPVVRYVVTPAEAWQKWELVFSDEQESACASVLGICSWTDEKPVAAGPYRLEVALEAAQATVGGGGELSVRLLGKSMSPAVVNLGIPAGVEPDLRDLPLDAQMRGRYLQLRFASPFRQPQAWVRAPDAIEFRVPVRFLWAGRFTGPPSFVVPERGHPHEQRFWAEPLRIDVSP